MDPMQIQILKNWNYGDRCFLEGVPITCFILCRRGAWFARMATQVGQAKYPFGEVNKNPGYGNRGRKIE